MATNILFVDDEEALLELIAMIFEEDVLDGKFKTNFALSGKDALKKLNSEEGKDISVLVTDINMPYLSGFELVKQVKINFPNILIYMMSAYEDQKTLEEVRMLDIKHYFNKPVDFIDLKRTIEEDVA
ncbi:response regulator receiver domain protein [Bacteriovorax sp. BAL6_X]|uniref:response regulator n=1 Tax=Bacteriovorax sp. BAL6_X TaxID=1201290 RepID=UPI000385E346|nr:response regulator [Bacteriovorax sp. BAL6_X]EPZ52124.1 response regulator receiver domain protein [Bacteriovorax sp. BAL6_X]